MAKKKPAAAFEESPFENTAAKMRRLREIHANAKANKAKTKSAEMEKLRKIDAAEMAKLYDAKTNQSIDVETWDPVADARASIDAKNAELHRLRDVMTQVERFTAMIADQEAEIDEIRKTVDVAKSAYDRAKDDLAQVLENKAATQSDLVRFLRPKNGQVLPLFDTMAPADEDKHGRNADQWRAEPIAALRLSTVAHNALIDAEIMLVGQLQDRMIQRGQSWFDDLAGINLATASAIADKLNDFICDRSEE
jgi:hypothetical protein